MIKVWTQTTLADMLRSAAADPILQTRVGIEVCGNRAAHRAALRDLESSTVG
jgi:hypothetical protein